MTDGETAQGATPEGGGGVPCGEVLADLERYLDGELPESRLEQLRGHLADCHPCADRATFHEQIRALVRDCCAEQAPPQLLARIRSQLGVTVGGRDHTD